jgi:hypothetical protein
MAESRGCPGIYACWLLRGAALGKKKKRAPENSGSQLRRKVVHEHEGALFCLFNFLLRFNFFHIHFGSVFLLRSTAHRGDEVSIAD